RPFLHPVVRSIILHFWLGYDHPFVDGNGRTARALFYWSMARHGYWLCEFISISRVIKRAPSKYSRAFLYTETDANDLTYFLLNQLRTTLQAIVALHEYLARKAEQLTATRRLLASSRSLNAGLNHRQLALVNHAIRNPGSAYSIESHRRSHDVSYQTARKDLLDLATMGLLTQQTAGSAGRGRKAFAFLAPSDLETRLTSLPTARLLPARGRG
ncbi:MAG: Fic family protein, partial [Gemmatimonadales bacterium]|nr:Fic family protein [Gemmatimonadales bacterium]